MPEEEEDLQQNPMVMILGLWMLLALPDVRSEYHQDDFIVPAQCRNVESMIRQDEPVGRTYIHQKYTLGIPNHGWITIGSKTGISCIYHPESPGCTSFSNVRNQFEALLMCLARRIGSQVPLHGTWFASPRIQHWAKYSRLDTPFLIVHRLAMLAQRDPQHYLEHLASLSIEHSSVIQACVRQSQLSAETMKCWIPLMGLNYKT